MSDHFVTIHLENLYYLLIKEDTGAAITVFALTEEMES